MIKIKIVDDVKNEIEKDKKLLKALEKGEAKLEKGHIIILSPEGFHSLFSPKRIKLLRTIKRNDVKSIYELAKILKRPYEAVYNDIKYLESFKILRIEKKNHSRIPMLIDEDLRVPALV